VKQKRPEFYGLLPDGAKIESGIHGNIEDKAEEGNHDAPNFVEEEYAFKAAIKTRAYWILALVLSMYMFIYGAITVHTIPFLTDMGISRTVASAMMSLMVLLTVPSRFLGGIITDYIPKNRLNYLVAVVLFLQAAGIAVFLVSRDRASIYIMFILYGLGSGACPPLFILLTGRYFGRKAFGSILGSSLALRAPASLASPVFAGWVYDRTGNYIMAFTLFLALAALATLLMIFLKPPVPPGKKG
jgi:nitrate/nitrite transporter NarK